MKSRIFILIAVVLSTVTIGSFVAMAGGEKKTNASEGKKAAGDENLDYLRVSGELARIASGSKDAILMLAAARLEAMANTEDVSRDKTTQGAQGSNNPKPEKEDLYTRAQKLAGTNEALHILIEGSRNSGASRGVPGGPESMYTTVQANDTDIFRVTFTGGEWAEVAVIGDGDTDLDLHVYDENGNLVERDTDSTDAAYCRWLPRWTGVFRIEVRNWGSVYNRYRIVTN